MSVLAASHLTVRRGGRAILDNVSLTLEGGGVTALIGANGAGKSTLLHCLAGLLKPDAGEVSLDGRALAAWKDRELAQARAFVPQNPHVDWPISVERLVALGLTPVLPAFGGLPVEMSRRVDEVMAQCDLSDHREQPAPTLSGGELSRAMLARALVGDPAVLIVDEPTTGLDPRHALDTMARLKALGGSGRLIVAAVHDLTLAARHADGLIALSEGRVVAHGPIGEVLTPELVFEVFGVHARITETQDGPLVDLLTRV